MSRIEVYTSPWCGFCYRAKAMLADQGLDFDEIDVTGPPEHRRAMVERSGRSSVPQIFIDGAPIGGADELARLCASGALDRLHDTGDATTTG